MDTWRYSARSERVMTSGEQRVDEVPWRHVAWPDCSSCCPFRATEVGTRSGFAAPQSWPGLIANALPPCRGEKVVGLVRDVAGGLARRAGPVTTATQKDG